MTMPHPPASKFQHAPIDAPLRPIEMAVHTDDDPETDGDGAIFIIAIALFFVLAIAALVIFSVPS